ncbi:MAG: PQQ-dependent sugar dehydrogenase, partial [Planctomycetota bacterium]|nr:PQQ-dependent sugar dehydrogenase [Planctomycetota bacterium]
MKIQLVAGAILALAGALIFTGELAARSTSPATAATAAEIGDADNLDRGTVPLTSVRIAAGLSQPLYVTAPTGDFDRVFIVEKTGAIRIYRPSTGSVLPTPYLNIATRIISSGSEQGLLGLAFHPDFAVNGFFYVYFTAAPNSPAATTYIARYQAMGDPMTSNTADPSSEQIVLSQSQPFTNHNGGWVGFGKDGFLYAAFGDGGSAFDPGNNAQTITTNFLGKMLRIDVDGDDFPADPNRNYAVPASNPFVGVTGLDEIWAYGLRNHFRNSFDRETGDLWMGDVGQSSQEEIDFQPASSTGGENYGWRCMEGNLCTGRTGCTCMDPVLTDPIFTYARSGGQCAITGGYV